jgi:hypothetical protein
MEILIVSKTHKGNAACVGGFVVHNNQFVRLLNPGNWGQYADTEFEIGDIWDIGFQNREDIDPPHVEDVIVKTKIFVKKIKSLSEFIKKSGIIIELGSPSKLFNGLLSWSVNGSGYIGNKENLPPHSVGFWISDRNLVLDEDEKHYLYQSNNPFIKSKRFPYVGFKPKVNVIPEGTLMRVSLARWWKPEDSEISERCYLQLSGWYL